MLMRTEKESVNRIFSHSCLNAMALLLLSAFLFGTGCEKEPPPPPPPDRSITVAIQGDGCKQASSQVSNNTGILFVEHKPGNVVNTSLGSTSDPYSPYAVSYAGLPPGNTNVTISCDPDVSLPGVVVVGTDSEYTDDLCLSEEIQFPFPHELAFYILNGKDFLTGKPWVKLELAQTSGPAVDLNNALSNSEGKGNLDIFSRTVLLPGPGTYEFTLNAIDTRNGNPIPAPLFNGVTFNTNKVLVCQSAATQVPEVHAVRPEEGDKSSNVVTVQGALPTDLVPLQGSGTGASSTTWLASNSVNITNPLSIETTALFGQKTGHVLLVGTNGSYKKTDMAKYVFPEGSGNDALINVQIVGSAAVCTPNAPLAEGLNTIKPGPGVSLTATVSGSAAGKLLKYADINQYTAGNFPVTLNINEEGRGKLVWVCPAAGQKALTVHRIGPGHVAFEPVGQLDIPEENIRLYNEGQTVTLVAIPESGYSFDRWIGGGVPGGFEQLNPLTGTMDINRYIAARFKKNSSPAGIVSISPDPADPSRVLFSSPVSLGANVPDLDHNGAVNVLDDVLFQKCVGGSGNQPFGSDLLNPGSYDPDLNLCYQADFDADGDVDDDDRKVFMNCLKDSNNPAPGFTCFGAGPQAVSSFEVSIQKDGSEADHLVSPTDYQVPEGQEGLYTFEITAGQITRKVQIELPIHVKLSLGRSEDGSAQTDEGYISVVAQGSLPVGWPSCPSTVEGEPSECVFPASTIVNLSAVPGPGYQFIGWQVQRAPGDIPGLSDLTDPNVTITLNWVDGGGPYVIKAMMAEEDNP